LPRVRLSAQAAVYLRAEAHYLRRHSRRAAKAFVLRMQEARTNLARFPDIGVGSARLPVPGARRLIVGDYVLDYDYSDDVVTVLAIRHGRQQPSDIEPDEDFDYEA
jgi:plasmid stabilization system protein ParE